MANKISDKVVVITGASSGVGRAIAREFGRRGAKVALIARNTEALQNAAREIENTRRGRALVLPLDVADASAVQKAAEQVSAQWGTIDIWINDAMVNVFSPAIEIKPEEYRRIIEVNYLGYVYGTLAALKHMCPKNSGHIIQIGSAFAYRSIPLQSAYCASKAAVRGFTDSLRRELYYEQSNVKISVVHLPAVNTPQFNVARSRLPNRPSPVPPIYQPEMIARAVLRVAKRPVRERWVGWSAMRAIVGQMLIPGVFDRYLERVGYAAQQTSQPALAGRPDNVDQPIPGDKGARGAFDDRARRWSSEVLLCSRGGVLAVAVTAGIIGWKVFRWKRSLSRGAGLRPWVHR